MSKHRLRIDYDEGTGKLTVRHSCTVELGGHSIHSSEDVDLLDEDEYAATLRALIDTNRKHMEGLATANAIEHVAALQGIKKKGRQYLKLEGTMGPVSQSQTEKRP